MPSLTTVLWTPVCWPVRGGLSTVVHSLAQAASEAGDTVRVVRPVGSRSEEGEDAHCRRICIPEPGAGGSLVARARRGLLSARARRVARRMLREERADLLHLHFPGDRFDVLSRQNRPLVITYHGSDVLQLERGRPSPVLDRLNRKASRIVVVSEFLKRDLLARRPELEPKVVCVRNGRPGIAPLEREHAEGENGCRLLFVGDLLPVKGVDLLVEAFGRLRGEGARCSLTLLGAGKEEPRLRRRLEELGLAGEVTFRGEVGPEEVRAEMVRADLLVLPSRREGLPNVPLEAMAAGCPVLGSTAGGIPEVVMDGRNGRLFPAGDVDALCERLRELVGSPELRRRLAEGGRKSVEAYPDWGQVYRQYREHYVEVIREAAAGGMRRASEEGA